MPDVETYMVPRLMAKAKPRRSVVLSFKFQTIFQGSKVNHTSMMMETTVKEEETLDRAGAE